MTSSINNCRSLEECSEENEIVYTICTLVTDLVQYEEMVSSCLDKGFTPPDCEYIYLDNSRGNKYDAYAACNKFISAARGSYIILCHQDIILLEDGRSKLDSIVQRMNELDPTWAVLGNAGGTSNGSVVVRISDRYGENQSFGCFPGRVDSVDENFIIVRRSANLSLSNDLTGFHLYGADLCIIASILGYRAYVIDFHLRHNGQGKVDKSFISARQAISRKYGIALKPRWIQTTCTFFFLSGNPRLNNILNSWTLFRVMCRYPKLKKFIINVIF
jgi:hypothetical protein